MFRLVWYLSQSNTTTIAAEFVSGLQARFGEEAYARLVGFDADFESAPMFDADFESEPIARRGDG